MNTHEFQWDFPFPLEFPHIQAAILLKSGYLSSDTEKNVGQNPLVNISFRKLQPYVCWNHFSMHAVPSCAHKVAEVATECKPRPEWKQIYGKRNLLALHSSQSICCFKNVQFPRFLSSLVLLINIGRRQAIK